MRFDYCVACGASEHLDHHHLVPRSRGGSDHESNVITLCTVCHGKAHDRLQPIDWKLLQNEGRDRAKANGVRFGRKLKLSPEQRLEAVARRAAGETLMSIADSYGVHFSMISRLPSQ
jgi:hypothetical protein